ncbi:MAG: thiamine pyrophosphate-dependent enzyme, partial [Acidobacteriota bacterium]
QIVLTYFGDGATSEGDFHEALNFAGVAQLPVVFVCQNNQYAISLPREKQTRSRTIAQKSIAYGFPGVQVDGNDVLAVYRATREAVDRARSGQGPTLIECVTYRLSVHTTADDPTRYRTQEEVARWEAREPLSRLQVYLRRRGILDDDLVREDEEEAGRRIDDAWKQAHGKMQHLGDPLEMFEHGTARRSPYLEEQRENFAKFLEETEGR